MNKILLSIFIALTTNPLFCAEQRKAAAAALHDAAKPLKNLSTVIRPVSDLKETQILEHAIFHWQVKNPGPRLTPDERNKLSFFNERKKGPLTKEQVYFKNFRAMLTSKQEILIGVEEEKLYEDKETKDRGYLKELVGSLFGRRITGPNADLSLEKGDQAFQICSITVQHAQQSAIGALMVNALKCSIPTLPFITYTKKADLKTQQFWQEQGFTMMTYEASAAALLKESFGENPPIEAKDIIVYRRKQK